MASGTGVKFNIEATGDHLTFQWQKDCSDLSDGVKYRNTKTCTLRIVEVGKDDKGCYRCCVSNDKGEMFSEDAVLRVSKLVIHVVMCFHISKVEKSDNKASYQCHIKNDVDEKFSK